MKIVIAILGIIVLILIGIGHIINHFNYDCLIPYITRRSKEEIINSRIRLFIISLILKDATSPFDIEDDVTPDYKRLAEVDNRYDMKSEINTYELVKEIRQGYIINKPIKNLEEKIEIEIWISLVYWVQDGDFNKKKHVLEIIDIERLKKYLIDHRY